MKETVTVVEHGRDSNGRPVATEMELDRDSGLPWYLATREGDGG